MKISQAGLALAALVLSSRCGPPSVRPVSYADPEVACPGGRAAWNLEVLDRRAEREATEKVVAAIRDGIQKSFPGCRWDAGAADRITIEVYRFVSRLDRGSWDAAVEWSVSAQSAAGSTLTEFPASEELSRPDYQGVNNEKESLSEAFQRALERTVKGLRVVPSSTLRPPGGTPATGPASGREASGGA